MNAIQPYSSHLSKGGAAAEICKSNRRASETAAGTRATLHVEAASGTRATLHVEAASGTPAA